jgi:hypothetical protein
LLETEHGERGGRRILVRSGSGQRLGIDRQLYALLQELAAIVGT